MSRAAGAGSGASAAAVTAPAAAFDDGDDDGLILNYLEHSHRPLTSLVFVLPMIVIYEFSTNAWGGILGDRAPAPIIAFTLMQQFFGLFGATGRYLPAAAVFGMLLGWHVSKKYEWRVRIPYLFGMAFESLVLSVPLIALGSLLDFALSGRLLAGLSTNEPAHDLVAICLGAGLYEELVFRLLLMSVLSLIVRDTLGVGAKRSNLLVVVTAAVLFAGYHYLGAEQFHMRTFVFRTIAGVYFGALFSVRGFGVTAGSHAAYDLLYAFRVL